MENTTATANSLNTGHTLASAGGGFTSWNGPTAGASSRTAQFGAPDSAKLYETSAVSSTGDASKLISRLDASNIGNSALRTNRLPGVTTFTTALNRVNGHGHSSAPVSHLLTPTPSIVESSGKRSSNIANVMNGTNTTSNQSVSPPSNPLLPVSPHPPSSAIHQSPQQSSGQQFQPHTQHPQHPQHQQPQQQHQQQHQLPPPQQEHQQQLQSPIAAIVPAPVNDHVAQQQQQPQPLLSAQHGGTVIGTPTASGGQSEPASVSGSISAVSSPSPTSSDKGDDLSEKVMARPNRNLSQSKRAIQNRTAQRAFRQRKELYIRDLEQKVEELKQAHKTISELREENTDLRDYILALQSRWVNEPGVPTPPAVYKLFRRGLPEFKSSDNNGAARPTSPTGGHFHPYARHDQPKTDSSHSTGGPTGEQN
ncbi:hypothetical protein AWJ20_1934 [Sugiyamaella lignohabitans]|uniref:Putative transcription factor kapC n=1 Tax=Sugiyamaella lignohabitans TaxID=796027 RepID=A0A167E4S2_9ASCO|nr:uncharacterized protein AWJ20_1934 [Sugiyamaella lignohabitans]ANB13635.1 hypothetical protein AWJ20_1934 [Sugiyamaella lignohabitans]